MRLFCQIVNTVNVPFRNVKNKKSWEKRVSQLNLEDKKIMVNRVMNIESVTNSIEHVTFFKPQKNLG